MSNSNSNSNSINNSKDNYSWLTIGKSFKSSHDVNEVSESSNQISFRNTNENHSYDQSIVSNTRNIGNSSISFRNSVPSEAVVLLETQKRKSREENENVSYKRHLSHKKEKKEKKLSKKDKKDKKSKRKVKHYDSSSKIQRSDHLPVTIHSSITFNNRQEEKEKDDDDDDDDSFLSSDSSSNGGDRNDSDIESDKDYTSQLVNLSKDSEVIHLPNGNILISDKNVPRAILNEDYTISHHADREILLTSGFYRGDIPKYIVHDGESYKSSTRFVKESYHIPSGAVIISNSKSDLNKECFIPLYKRISIKDSNRMPRGDRYYLPSKNILISSNRLSIESIQLSKSTLKRSNTLSSNGSGFIPVTPFTSPNEEIASIQSVTVDNNNSNQTEDIIKLQSEAQMYQDMAMTMARDLNMSIRNKPSNHNHFDAIAWLNLVSKQNILHKYQMLGSNNISNIPFIEYYPSEKKFILDKKLFILEDAINKAKSIVQSTIPSTEQDQIIHNLAILYQYYLQLVAAYLLPEKVSVLWNNALTDCPLNITLRLNHLIYIGTVFSKDLSMSYMRETYIKEYQQLIHQIRSIEATRLLSSGWTAINITASINKRNNNNLIRDSDINSLPEHLQEDVEAYRIDTIANLMLVELEAGYTERVYALTQALLDYNFSVIDPSHLDDMETFWESEYPRLGELNTISTLISSNNHDLLGCGMISWKRENRPSDTTDIWDKIVKFYKNSYPSIDWSGDLMENIKSFAILNLDNDDYNNSNNCYEQVSVRLDDKKPIDSMDIMIPSHFDDNDKNNSNSNNDDDNDNSSSLLSGRRMRAFDYFKDIVEEENIHAVNAIGFSDPMNPSDPLITTDSKHNKNSNSSNIDEDLELGYRMVYSRVHGYRIPVPIAPTTDPAYNRALRILKSSNPEDNDDKVGSNHQEHDQDSKTRIQQKIESKTNPVYSEDVINVTMIAKKYKRQYLLEHIVSSIQFRPLRIYASSDSDMATAQPMRVILFEDIKPNMIYVSNPKNKTRLFVRLFEGLGLYIPFARSSLSYSYRNSGILSGDLTIGVTAYAFFTSILQKTIRENIIYSSKTMPTYQSEYERLFTAHIVQIISSEDLVLSLLSKPLLYPLIVDDSLLSQHILCYQLSSESIDSKLNFLIRLVSCLESMPLESKGMILYLRRSHMCLLAQKFEVMYAGTNRNSVRNNSIDRNMNMDINMDKQRDEYREAASKLIKECKSIVQNCENSGEKNMTIWSTYLVIDANYGDFNSIYKVCDKLIVAVVSKIQESTPTVNRSDRFTLFHKLSSNNSSSKKNMDEIIPGSIHLIWTIIRIGLGLSLRSFNSSSSMENSSVVKISSVIKLIMDFTLGLSNGDSYYFREKKKSSGKKDKYSEDINQKELTETIECLQSYVVDLIQDIVMEIENTKKSISLENSIHATRLYTETIDNIDSLPVVYYVTSLLVWLVCLSDSLQAADTILITVINELLSLLSSSSHDDYNSNSNNSTNILSLRQIISVQENSVTSNNMPFFEYKNNNRNSDKKIIEISLYEAQAIVGEVAKVIASSIGQSIALLLESLLLLRIELWVFVKKEGQRMSNTIKVKIKSPTIDIATEITISSSKLVDIVLDGLFHFPINPSLLNTLWILESKRSGGYLRMKSYLHKQNERIVYGGGLSVPERIFRVFMEASRAIDHRYNQYLLIQSSLSTSINKGIPNDEDYNNIITDTIFTDWLVDDKKHIIRVLESMVHDPVGQYLPWLWKYYVKQRAMMSNYDSSSIQECKKILFRSSRRCSIHKSLWLELWGTIASHDKETRRVVISEKELNDMEEIMFDRGIHIRSFPSISNK